jgi:DNA (cytosine-5)-methyltransferase 1
MNRVLTVDDLFCGAGGTSEGAVEAAEWLGYEVDLLAVNHWERAAETYRANFPRARVLCTGVDSINPRQLHQKRRLNLLWGSPECQGHSNGRGDKPTCEQDRATAMCLARWTEALQPDTVLVENVLQFRRWGPLDARGRPIKAREGELFRAWFNLFLAMGYRGGEWVGVAADFGDPTSRERLFIQFVRGRRRVVWPNPTHAPAGSEFSLFGRLRTHVPARAVIDWSIPAQPIDLRDRPLRENTLKKIREGLEEFGGEPFLVCMEHGGRIRSADEPFPVITTAKGGAIGVAEPFLIEYYGTGGAKSVDVPLGAVTTRDRFGLVVPSSTGVRFRMLQVKEYAAAQGFRPTHVFTGKKKEQIKQIGNAVPRRLARAIVAATLSQNPDVSWLADREEAETSIASN